MNDVAIYDFGARGSAEETLLPQAARQNYDNVGPFTAVVLAGSRRPQDSVAAMFGENYKALVAIDGRPMIARVVDALRASRSVRKIIILFDDAQALLAACPGFAAKGARVPVEIMACRDTICDSVAAAFEGSGGRWPYLVTTADHALLTPTIVDRFCADARGRHGVSVGLVERRHIEAHQPGSRRTYLPFKGEGFSGANLFAFMGGEAASAIAFWKRIENERKRPWRLFAAFGVRNLLGLLFRRYDVDRAFARASSSLGVAISAVKLPFAEAAIDVDSPADYHQVSDILARRRATLASLRASLNLELGGADRHPRAAE